MDDATMRALEAMTDRIVASNLAVVAAIYDAAKVPIPSGTPELKALATMSAVQTFMTKRQSR